MSKQDQIQNRTESLTDLPLTAEHADQTKAGTPLFREQLTGEGKQVKIDFCQ